MKKLMSIFGAALFVFALASCGPEETTDDANKDGDKKDAPAPADKKDDATK